ncbi:cytochrome P450 4V2-like [Amblyomma americanum]
MSAHEKIAASASGYSPVAALVLLALATAVLAKVVMALARWIRMYWCLRNVPHPKQRWPFSLAIDMWQSLAKMDPNLEITARIFNYFEEMFKTIHDQEVTVAYYGPQPFLIAATPKALEPVLNNSQNLNKAFLYKMMKPWIGNGILIIDKSLWRSRRKLITPAFHFRVMDDYAPIMNRRAREMLCKLDAVGTEFFDVLPIMRLAAFGILFGLRPKKGERALDAFVPCAHQSEKQAYHGFETTASAIAYTLFLLGNHPEVQAKVLEEIDSIFGDDQERDVTIEDMKQLKYMECVFKESMRLYPPVPLIARNVDEDMKVGEYTVPKGAVAVAAIYFIQRHPKYFEKPDCFIPERFLDTKEKNPFQYIPFSGGLRNCIGQRFANLEEKILLTQIMRRYTVTSKLRMDQLQLSIEVVLKATQGMEIKIKPREKVKKQAESVTGNAHSQ